MSIQRFNDAQTRGAKDRLVSIGFVLLVGVAVLLNAGVIYVVAHFVLKF